ncbi:MAG: AI-2E family transporter [Deltaproteobacteria bacterium]|nr:AI-2E family transporter [Deltaproteobacteria bacterium]
MAAPTRSPNRRARLTFLTASAVGFAAIVIVGQGVLLPFLLAVLLAYALFPLVRQVERPRIPRWVAILVVYAVTIGAAAGFAWATVPRLFAETKKLGVELPRLTRRVRDVWLQDLRLRPQRDGSWSLGRAEAEQRQFSSARAFGEAFDEAVAYAQHNAAEILRFGRELIAGVSRGVFYFFITLMLAGYLMHSYERIHGFVRSMWPEHRRAAFDRFLVRVDRGMAGVVRGQLLICLVNGILSAVGFWIFDVKYWPILACVAAAMSIIPIFGSILSSVPAVAIGLTDGLPTALGVLVWIVGIHQLEANLLNPKIIGDQAKIHPVLVVFALLLGEHFFRIAGALLAVPCLCLAQAVFLHFRESVLGQPQVQTAASGEEAAGGAAAESAPPATPRSAGGAAAPRPVPRAERQPPPPTQRSPLTSSPPPSTDGSPGSKP